MYQFNRFTTLSSHLARANRGSALWSAALLFTALTITTPASAKAQPLITFDNDDQIEDLLDAVGSVTRETDSEDILMFRGRVDGHKYALYFYGCENLKHCESASFSAFFDKDLFDLDLEAVNAFNSEHRFGTASIDEDGDLELEYSFTLLGGLTPAAFEDTIDWWRAVLDSGTEFFEDYAK